MTNNQARVFNLKKKPSIIGKEDKLCYKQQCQTLYWLFTGGSTLLIDDCYT